MGNTQQLYQIISSEFNNNLCLATVVEGPEQGGKILLGDEGLLWSSQDEGANLLLRHQELLQKQEGSGLFSLEDSRIFAEYFGGEERLVICGAGHVSMPIIRLGKMIGFQVIVLEDREDFAAKAKSMGADQVICAPFEQALSNMEDNDNSYYVVVTRAHGYDKDCLREILKKKFAYVGMMGSGRRVGLVKKQLEEEGISSKLLQEVHSPIGLSIQAETPEEIAISIMAEIISVRRGKKQTDGFSKEMLKELSGEVAQGGSKHIEKLEKAEDKSFVLATIIARQGSAPRSIGTKMLVREDGYFLGTIGGGLLEYEVHRNALDMLSDLENDIDYKKVTVQLADSESGKEGMVCGGIVDVYLERVR